MDLIQIESRQGIYPVHIGNEILPDLLSLISSFQPPVSDIVVVADEQVLSHWEEPLRDSISDLLENGSILDVPAGEDSKTLSTAGTLCSQLMDAHIDRDALLITFGGGMVGDLGGFVASIYMRGIRYVHVPTSLLSQVDACVGGKVGVNHNGAKNMLGDFYPPEACLLDIQFLSTLGDREYREGLAEVIKYALIQDASFLDWIEDRVEAILDRDPAVLETLVARCVGYKRDVVEQDETEAGRRAILNFGHTLGHAIEVVSPPDTYLHGEAIAPGMLAALKISRKEGYLEDDSLEDRIRTLFEAFSLPVSIRDCSLEDLKERLQHDKKGTRGTPRWVLLESTGNPVWDIQVPEKTIEDVIQSMRETEESA